MGLKRGKDRLSRSFWITLKRLSRITFSILLRSVRDRLKRTSPASPGKDVRNSLEHTLCRALREQHAILAIRKGVYCESSHVYVNRRMLEEIFIQDKKPAMNNYRKTINFRTRLMFALFVLHAKMPISIFDMPIINFIPNNSFILKLILHQYYSCTNVDIN